MFMTNWLAMNGAVKNDGVIFDDSTKMTVCQIAPEKLTKEPGMW